MLSNPFKSVPAAGFARLIPTVAPYYALYSQSAGRTIYYEDIYIVVLVTRVHDQSACSLLPLCSLLSKVFKC